MFFQAFKDNKAVIKVKPKVNLNSVLVRNNVKNDNPSDNGNYVPVYLLFGNLIKDTDVLVLKVPILVQLVMFVVVVNVKGDINSVLRN